MENPYIVHSKILLGANATGEQIKTDVQGGNRVMPTIDEVLAELPVYE